ncbi:hypothetical protein CDCA_CDCA15G4062 [Cyanidium caldarium]|uniref:Flavoprotein domain-containing protein n=1 Tax=Cyanidium caldarium TaxID=2771 RepID=A0AAV9J0D0_CYACA|nr:hypothetical protein CDCA_CDCA15G4062 [Cyanidium caldarium]
MTPSDSILSHRTVLLGVTGSVAAIRVPALIQLLVARGASVVVVRTRHARHFLSDAEIDAVAASTDCSRVRRYDDVHEWEQWRALGDPVLHIELRRQADVFLVAPLSANTLAKLANGLADNLITCTARAWDWQRRPVWLAPAMNTAMYEHPFTAEHLQRLMRLGARVLPPVHKRLACGDEGVGAMPSPEAIVTGMEEGLRAMTTMVAGPRPAHPSAPLYPTPLTPAAIDRFADPPALPATARAPDAAPHSPPSL